VLNDVGQQFSDQGWVVWCIGLNISLIFTIPKKHIVHTFSPF